MNNAHDYLRNLVAISAMYLPWKWAPNFARRSLYSIPEA
jgi:hypothetical protein